MGENVESHEEEAETHDGFAESFLVEAFEEGQEIADTEGGN